MTVPVSRQENTPMTDEKWRRAECVVCRQNITWTQTAGWINRSGVDPLRCPPSGGSHVPAEGSR